MGWWGYYRVKKLNNFVVSIQYVSSSLMAILKQVTHHDRTKQRGSETKTYILTKAVGMAYGDNGPLFTKLLGGA